MTARGGRVEGKVVVVCGGARGQGAAEARLLHSEGAAVVVADVLEAEGARLAAELGERCLFVRHDTTDEASWDRLIAETTRAFGTMTGLVQGAGVFAPAPLRSTSTEQYLRTHAVNQLGSFLALRSAAGAMTDGGSVVLVSSTAAHAPSGSGVVPYTATKWAVRGMAHSAAIELAAAGIRVNTVAPGAVVTPMITDTLTDSARDGLVAAIPLARMAQPAEIAPLVLYLISDESAYCTGADFVIDGGMTAGVYRTSNG